MLPRRLLRLMVISDPACQHNDSEMDWTAKPGTLELRALIELTENDFILSSTSWKILSVMSIKRLFLIFWSRDFFYCCGIYVQQCNSTNPAVPSSPPHPAGSLEIIDIILECALTNRDLSGLTRLRVVSFPSFLYGPFEWQH